MHAKISPENPHGYDRYGFAVVDFDGGGFFRRIILVANYFVPGGRPMQTLYRRLLLLDAKWFESANLFCLARKQRCLAREQR